jgi:hypothetical protein
VVGFRVEEKRFAVRASCDPQPKHGRGRSGLRTVVGDEHPQWVAHRLGMAVA